jgi:hypothetical protein
MTCLTSETNFHRHRREESWIAHPLAKEQMEKICQKGKVWQSRLRKEAWKRPDNSRRVDKSISEKKDGQLQGVQPLSISVPQLKFDWSF